MIIELDALAFIKARYDWNEVRIAIDPVITGESKAEGLIEPPIQQRHMRETAREELIVPILTQDGFPGPRKSSLVE